MLPVFPGVRMKIRSLLFILVSVLLLTGCVTAGYGYRGDGYHYGGSTVIYRSNRGYPYGYYDGYYRYGKPYGYYGPSYGYPYRYNRYYTYPAPHYRYRPVYPRHGHYDYPRHRTRPPSSHPGGGKPPWRDLNRLRPPTQGHQIAPPPAVPSFRPAVGQGDAPRQRPERGRLQGEIKAAQNRE